MLDRAQPYCTLHPPHEGAFFEQDGQRFDEQGRPLGRQRRAAPERTAAAVEPAPEAPASQVDAQLSE